MAKHNVWSKSMDRYLKANYHKRTAREIAERLEVSKSAVLRRAKKLNLESKAYATTAERRVYSDDEIRFIQESAQKLSIEKIAEHLNRSSDAVRKKANRMNLLTATKVKPFSEDELNFLRDNIGSMSYRGIATMLNRGEEQTRWYARKLGLKRPRS
jgi:transposase